MSAPSSLPPERVPTLTEVIAWPEAAPAAAPRALQPPRAAATAVEAAAPPPVPVPALRQPEEQMIQRVLAEVQRQVDLMLEYRLREVMTPLLARAADTLVRDARGELAAALRDVVDRAITQEIARHRSG